MKFKLIGFSLSLVLCLSTTACKDQSEAAAVLPTVCQYFPNSMIYKFDKRVLWIQTNVDGISSATAMEIFSDACQKAGKAIGQIKINAVEELQFDGRSILVIGFKKGIVACDLRGGGDANGVPRGQVLNWQMANAWFTQHIGYIPTASQISVITLADVKNTPKGEPMQLKTLAEMQAEKREKQQQEINDYVLKEKVGQGQSNN